MKQSLGLVALVIREYEEALEFYVGTLGFALIEDNLWLEDKDRYHAFMS